MSREPRERTIFPMLVSQGERQLLQQLSAESGLSRSGVLRNLLYKEFSSRQLAGAKPPAPRKADTATR